MRVRRRIGAALPALLGLVLAVLPAGGTRADECTPAEPQAEVAKARAAGHLVLSGEDAGRFAALLRGGPVPIGAADYVFLWAAEGAATMVWIDDARETVAIECEWQAPAGSPVAQIIERAIAQAR